MTRRLTTISMVPVLLWLLSACSDQGAQPPTPATTSDAPAPTGSNKAIHPPPAVQARLRIQTATLRAVPALITAPGEVALDLKQVAKITSRIGGQVERIHVQLGDRVKKGQALVAIGSLQLDQLIEEYLVGKAQADVAENSFRRTEKLRADDIVTERKLIEDKGLYLETQARYQHIRERLSNMGISTDDLKQGPHEKSHLYTLTAPIAGTVVIQNAVRGQGVGPGDELFELVDTSRVWVFANLPIEQARQFKEGDSGTITPKGGEAIVAPLTYLSPVADETTRTIRVRFEVANLHGQLKPREYVEVALGWSGPPVVTVPMTAITTIDKTRGLFLETADGYTFVPVDAGREGGGLLEIRRGVKEGDRIVTDGVFDLKNVLLKEHIGSGE
ncbi:MAG TPA: efflux RND transporter periplasmic adaptor subunit [Nitrospira sp.]|nr:efflux RND transporter periplasmic adaptor subunit [Nitrospira sp.]HQV11239.1 efflux RND transporter periplasmic adaptor subunit [Nitrospira sp.]